MSEKPFQPVIPASSTDREFTMRALLLGLVMWVVLGAANAYLGLRAGMTIAATYPAAVIGMAFLRLFKGSLLEENFARTVGSIGESVAAGAIFTIPAFVILGIWKFDPEDMFREYLTASALMVLGGILGIMFVTILRRVMVEDRSLPFPESVAASRDPQGRAPRRDRRRLAALPGDGGRGLHQAARRPRDLQRQERLPPDGRELRREPRPPRPDEGIQDGRRGRDHDDLRARDHAGVLRRRLHHRARAGRAELRRRPARLGAAACRCWSSSSARR